MANQPPYPGALRFPPRSASLATRIHLPLKEEGVGFARFLPFDAAREVLFFRGGPVRHLQPDPNVLAAIGEARVGPFGVVVLRHRQVSPQPQAGYPRVDDVLLLPDGELRIPREPAGFNDAEVGRIVASLQITSSTLPSDPANRDYWPNGVPPGEPSQGMAPQPMAVPMAGPPPGYVPPGVPGFGAGGGSGIGPGGGPPPGYGPGAPGPAPGAAMVGGGSVAAGREVVLQQNTFSMPPVCACCGRAKETTLKTSHRQNRVTRSFEIPYCGACASRIGANQRRGLQLGWLAFLIGVGLSLLTFALPGLPGVLLIGLPAVAAIAFAVVMGKKWAPPPPVAPATSNGHAVTLTSFRGARSTLYCTNAAWAAQFAAANGVNATEKKRKETFGRGALLTGIFVAPLAAIGCWFMTHPEIHIDNAGTTALQVWLDGSPRLVVEPNGAGVAPPSIYVAYGKHELGYSPVGASQPVALVEARARMMDDFLYNPGETACYWLVADRYGSASVAGISQGPQPIQEFYSFDNVDTWFGENPQSISVSNGQSGGTRIALQRAKVCMELAEHGCTLESRKELQQCQIAAKSDAEFDKCEDEVRCHGGEEPTAEEGTPSTAEPGHAVHPTPHTAPHPATTAHAATLGAPAHPATPPSPAKHP